MNRARAFAACALLAFSLGVAHPRLTLEVQVRRSSFDLLDPIAVTVSVWNHGTSRAALHFAHTAEYEVQVLDRDDVVSTTLASSQPLGVAHTRSFLPGVTTLAVYEFVVEDAAHSVPAPGNYRLRVRLLEDSGTLPVERTLHFEAPLPISTLAGMGTHTVTIAGTLAPDRLTLRDASGSVALSHRLLDMPVGALVAVRGAMIETPSRTQAFNPISWGVLNVAK